MVEYKNEEEMKENGGKLIAMQLYGFSQAARSEPFCNIHEVHQTNVNSGLASATSKGHGIRGDQRRFAGKHN